MSLIPVWSSQPWSELKSGNKQCTLCSTLMAWQPLVHKMRVSLFPAPFTARTSEACHRPMTHRRALIYGLIPWARAPEQRGQSVYCAYNCEACHRPMTHH